MNASEKNPASFHRIQNAILRFARFGAVVVLGASPLLHGAVSNVIVWTSARTSSQLDTTLQNAPTSSTGMRLWWKCDSGANVGWDSTGNAKHGTIKGTVAGIQMLNPWGVTRTVASGFNAPFCHLVGNPGIAYDADRTYEFWIRNPGQDYAVFFSLLRSKTGQVRGGQLSDHMRMWVEPDGSLKMADRGSSLQFGQSAPLTWDTDKWYQISVVYDVTGATHTVKVFRGERGITLPSTPLFSYTSDNLTSDHWLAIGGHEASYQTGERDDTGRPGFLGCDGNGNLANITPEMYGANGDDTLDDTAAWRRACAVLSAFGQGTLTLTAGKTYYVGKETVINDSSAETRWYEHEQMGWVVGARHGKVTVNGNGATVKLNPGMHFGGYDPLTGAAVDKLSGDSPYRDYSSDIGNLLHFENNLDVEVTNIKLDGSLSTQIWGGKYGDKGYQSRGDGLYFVGNDNVLVHNNVHSSHNALDGIGVTNNHLDDTSPLKKVTIYDVTAHHNGRQGLSYNCGNHLEIYDSDFSYTGKTLASNSPPLGDPAAKLNFPASGIDLEPMGRYMGSREWAGPDRAPIIENTTLFDNRAVGLLLTGSTPAIVRDCTIWQATSGRAVWVTGDMSPNNPDEGDMDDDHFFIRSRIYGQLYNKRGRRLRMEECVFVQADAAYYGPLGSNQPVLNRIALETINGGSIHLDRCQFEISQTNGSAVTRSTYAYNTVLENSTVHHANYQSDIATAEVARLYNGLLVNTDFTEAGFSNPNHRYTINHSASGTPSIVGPDVWMRGQHYITYGTSTANLPLAEDAVAPTPSAWRVLTPNAAAGEDQAPNSATYTASPAFNNPVDASNSRLFDRDMPWDDWNTTAGLQGQLEQEVKILLGQTRNVYSVKLRMKHGITRRPKRVYVSVGNGSTWTPMGLLRPDERDNLTNPDKWYSVTVSAPLVGSQVRLEFQIDGGWGWYINEAKVYGN